MPGARWIEGAAAPGAPAESAPDESAPDEGSPVEGALPDGTVDVVLVNFRSLADVAARLASPALLGQHVVVVDNGDDPSGVVELCRAHGATALLLPVNRGFAGGVNAGVATLPPRPRPVLLLNPDADLTTDVLHQLVSALAAGADGAAPLLTDPGGRPQVGAAGGRLTVGRVAAYFLGLSHLLPRVDGVFLTRRQLLRRSDVAWLCMACLLVSRDAWERFGAVPEDELVYAEDLAWGTSATDRGAVFRLLPDARVVHAQGSSGGSAAWVGALERLCVRRLGTVKGAIAVQCSRAGLAARRALGRRVS